MTPQAPAPTSPPITALEYFGRRLQFEVDVSDVHAALETGDPGFVLVDARGTESWDQGRIPGALHLPHREIADRAPTSVPRDRPVITYCWGPGCNGATRAAMAFAGLGYAVKEMIGGFEYWAREGFPVESSSGRNRRPVDPLVAPADSVTCDC